jgi:hypothetical protein
MDWDVEVPTAKPGSKNTEEKFASTFASEKSKERSWSSNFSQTGPKLILLRTLKAKKELHAEHTTNKAGGLCGNPGRKNRSMSDKHQYDRQSPDQIQPRRPCPFGDRTWLRN